MRMGQSLLGVGRIEYSNFLEKLGYYFSYDELKIDKVTSESHGEGLGRP